MDLFNKKKVEELERELRIVRDEFERNKGELIALKQYKGNDKISSQLAEENQKLIKWIMNILSVFGTIEVKDRRSIQIPVMKEKYISSYGIDYYGINEGERITIPEITIIKMQ